MLCSLIGTTCEPLCDQIAEAYEVLSDSNARKEYDRSGVKQRDKSQGNNNNNRGNQRHQPFWDFFGRRNQQARHDPLQHHLYRRHDVRQQVHAAQRRVRQTMIPYLVAGFD